MCMYFEKKQKHIIAVQNHKNNLNLRITPVTLILMAIELSILPWTN